MSRIGRSAWRRNASVQLPKMIWRARDSPKAPITTRSAAPLRRNDLRLRSNAVPGELPGEILHCVDHALVALHNTGEHHALGLGEDGHRGCDRASRVAGFLPAHHDRAGESLRRRGRRDQHRTTANQYQALERILRQPLLLLGAAHDYEIAVAGPGSWARPRQKGRNTPPPPAPSHTS